MSIRGSNGDFHSTLLSMLAEMKRDGKRMDQQLAALERRADQKIAALERRADQMERRADLMERRADQMEVRMEASDRRMKKIDEQLNRTARILAGAGEAFKSLDRRVTTLESRRD